MKRGLIILVEVLMLAGVTFGQVPSTVPFQAVVRDAAGNLLVNQAVCVQFTVQGAPPGNVIEYQETQTTATNNLGLLNVNVGGGTPNAVYAPSLGGVNWGAGAQYLDVSINTAGTCSGYTHMGAAQIMSVPYAIYAGSASSVSGTAGGDLSGNYPNPSVAQIQGVGVTASPAPTTGQVLEFNGSYWTPATAMGNATTGTTLTGVSVSIKGTTGINGVGSATTTLGSASSTTTVAGPATMNGGLTETGNITITTAGSGGTVINDPSPSPSAVLDLYSTTQGFLPTRVTTAQEAAINNPANGLLVYNTTTRCLDMAHSGIWESIYCNCPNLSSLNAISGNTSVCSGGTNTYSVASIQGASTYTWSVTGNPTITGNGTSSISFIAPTLTSYTVSVTAVNACGSSSVNQSVLVNDFTNVPTTPTWNPTPASSVCTGATVGYAINSSETGVNGTSALNYTWNISATGSASAVVNGQTVSSGNPLVFSNTSTTAYTFAYGSGTGSVTIGIVGNNTCGASTALTQTVTVDAQPALTDPTPSTQTVCTNGAIAAISTTPSGGTGTITYQWYSNTSNSNSGGTSLATSNGAQTTTYNPPARATISTVYYYVVMTSTGSGCNTATTANNASITVVAQPALTAPTPATETVCTNGAINNLSSTPSGGTGTITYQWYTSATNTNSGGAAISGATLTTYTPPSTATTGATYYYLVMSATGSGCNSASSGLNDALVSVVAQPSITNPTSASQTVCTNATISLSATGSNGTGTATYTWYNNGSTNSTSGGTVVGSNSASYPPVTTSVGGPNYYYVTYGTSGSGCITATASATASVTVVAQPTITNPTPSSQSLCVNGTPTSLTASGSGGTGTATYQWVSNGTTNSESGGSNVGTNSGTYTPPVTSAANTYYYIKYSTSGTGCNTAVATATANVTVAALPSLSSPTPALQSLCANTTVGSISTTLSGGAGTISYQWYEVGSNINSGGSPVSGATSSSFAPAAIATAGNYYYYATVTASGSGCGSATSPTNDAEVSITAGAPGTPSFTGSTSVTEGNAASAYTVSASNTSSYSWAVPSGWSASSTTGTSSNLTPPPASDGITYGGSVNISVTATNACNTKTGTYAVYVHGTETWAGGGGYSFTMPAGMSSTVTITMSGAGGGAAGNGAAGGAGAKLTCTYSNSASAAFTLYVGGAGSTSSTGAIGGYNGGGSAYEYYNGGQQGGGGGGATDVYVNSAEVLIAGAGGGGSYNYRCNASYTGGAGGGLNATAGAGGNCNNNNAGGGSETAGGGPGNDGAGPGTSGGLGYGGEAGVDYYDYGCGFLDFSTCYQYSGGGGGGAGYYGGGGGSAGAGGGGSSYPTGNTGNISGLAITAGGGSGSGVNGYCTISW